METEVLNLKREIETLKRENAELKETIDRLQQSLDEAVRGSRPKPQPAPRGVRPANSQSQASSETTHGSKDSEVHRQLNDAIQQLSETRKQLLNVQDQLTVGKQVTAATLRRQLAQERAYDTLPRSGAYNKLRFDSTQEHGYPTIQQSKHTGWYYCFLVIMM